jgi:Fur family peroxide stress response transcriptional regulator
VISIRELFNKHQLRCTKQRLSLYEALRKCKSHPSAEELLKMVSPDGVGMSRATVYNTLETLCIAGLARKMPVPGGCCRYDADTDEHLHVRLRDTSEICDVPQELGERLCQSLPQDVLAEIEKALNVKIEGVNIQLLGSRAS